MKTSTSINTKNTSYSRKYRDVYIFECSNGDFTKLINMRKKSDICILAICDKSLFKDAFDNGADSCIEPDFIKEELDARIRALKRRQKEMRFKDTALNTSKMSIDLKNGHVRVNGNHIVLSPAEYRTLTYLLLNKGTLIQKREMEMRAIANAPFGSDHLINMHLYNLRKKLGNNAVKIITVPRRGFVLEIV